MPRRFGYALLVTSIGVIVAATLVPFGALRSARLPPQWCLACADLWVTDGVSNVVLFAPFGAALGLLGVRARWVLVFAAAFSLFVEYMQSIGLPPSRSAALTDVLANTVGGVVGVAVVLRRRWVLAPTAREATALGSIWVVGAVAVLAFTSVAVGPRGPTVERAAYRNSTYTHTPLHGWFSGMVDTAAVDAFVQPHRGTGPVIIELARERRTVSASATLRGSEDGEAMVPIVFVHLPRDTFATVVLAQRGDAAELSVTRRAQDWGLAMPSLTLPGVFNGRTVNDPRILRLSAVAAPDHLELHARAEHFAGDRTFPLTPTLGWAMIQTLIGVDSPFALVTRAGWLAAFVVPVGWWVAQTGRRRASALGVAAAMLVAGAASMPWLFGVAQIGWGDWGIMGTFYIMAAVSGARRTVSLPTIQSASL